MKLAITPDYVTKSLKLCWKAKAGGQWGHAEAIDITDEAAARNIKYLNNVFPELEHWYEEVS